VRLLLTSNDRVSVCFSRRRRPCGRGIGDPTGDWQIVFSGTSSS